MKRLRIAIDGPGGAGKSTIARRVARALGIAYLDTGAMYRAAGLAAARQGLEPQDEAEIEALLETLDLTVVFDEEGQDICLDGERLGDQIRTPEASRWASDISRLPACRHKMVALQRRLASGQDLVMDGRDIGSYVLPDAEIKIYLDASLEERARRRLKQERELDPQATLESVARDLAWRDRQDSERELAPLVCTPEHHRLDSTANTADETTAAVLAWIYSQYPERIRSDQETGGANGG
ncbi:MAG: (d)CMP kinase [Bacillota bacterium]|nr:(d)CMP kinase [Bacillota bacterium]